MHITCLSLVSGEKMEVCECPNIPLRAWPWPDFPCGISGDHQRRIEYNSSVVFAVLSNLFYAILVCFFGVGRFLSFPFLSFFLCVNCSSTLYQ